MWSPSALPYLPDVDDSPLRVVNYLTIQHQVKNSGGK